MKRTLFCFIFSFSLLVCHGQSFPWVTESTLNSLSCLGESGSSNCVVADRQGNAYFAGWIYDTVTFGAFTLKAVSSSLFISKYDSNGNVLWVNQSYPASKTSYSSGSAVVLDKWSNIYLSGAFTDTVTVGTVTLKNKGSDDAILVKYSNAGTFKWIKQSTHPSMHAYAMGGAVGTDTGGNIYMAGEFVDTVSFGPYTLKSSVINNWSLFVTRYDSGGNVIWCKQAKLLNAAANMQVESMAVDKIGNSYITGFFFGTISMGTDTLKNLVNGPEFFLVKYDSSGNTVWAVQSVSASSACYAVGNSVSLDAYDNIYIAGGFSDTVTFGSIAFKTKTAYTLLAKYGNNGKILWAEKNNDASDNWLGVSVACDTLKQGGGYMVLTGSSATSSHYNLEMGGDTLYYTTPNTWVTALMHFDSAGNMICGNIFTEGIEDDGDGVGVDKSGKYIYLGGDIDGAAIIGSDTLTEPGYDIPFLTRWIDCKAVFKANINSTNVTCNGLCNGTATVTSYGGTGPYTYSWSGGQTTQNVNGLCPGSYSVVVSDAFGNKDNFNVAITEPPVLTATVSSKKNILCYGNKNGSISAGVSGGTSPYTYNWSNGKTSSTISSLAAGSYTFVVTDLNGCMDSAVATITQPAELYFNVFETQVTCYGANNGQAIITPGGGTMPYRYLWSNGTTTDSINNISAGTYTITLTDSNGCKHDTSVIITQPSQIKLSTSSINTSCPGKSDGKVSVVASNGVPPYSYKWSPMGSTTSSVSTLSTGVYVVVVSDSNGCLATDSAQVNLTPQGDSIKGNDSICDGNSDILSVTGGVAYLWSTGETTSSINVSPPSLTTYSVLVTTASGCKDSLSKTILINAKPVVSVCCDSTIFSGQAIQISASGGGTYMWTPVESLSCVNCYNPISSPGQTTTYVVEVTNGAGCVAVDSILITVENCGQVFIPSAFSPNNDGQNDRLFVRGKCITQMDFVIYDRWGNKVFESESLNTGWDGTYKGQPMNTGTYVWYLKGTLVDGSVLDKKGNVELVR